MITFEDIYNEFNLKMNFGIPFENLTPVTAVIPKGIFESLKIGYQTAIEQSEFKGTFEEYIGIVILGGLALRKITDEIIK